MSGSINPVAVADETGLAYTNGDAESVYILVQLSKDAQDSGALTVSLTTEGIDKKQAINVLREVLKAMESEETDSTLTVSVNS